MDNGHFKKVTLGGLLVTIGIIYGDIGTSPLYTFQTILKDGGAATTELVLGAISCVFWTLTLQTTFKYVLLTLQADNKGEGGIFSLYALVKRYGKKLVYPAMIGAGTLLADGIISYGVGIGHFTCIVHIPAFWNQGCRGGFRPGNGYLVFDAGCFRC